MIGNDDAENAVDGENDEDGLPRGTDVGGSDRHTRHQHRMVQALEINDTEFAGGNYFDVDNAEDTIDSPTSTEKQAYKKRKENLVHHYRQANERNEIFLS